MAKLFKTIADVKAFAANDFVNTFEVLDPYLKMAEEQITSDYLGEEQMAETVAFYDDGSPGDDAKKLQLLHYVQNIVVHTAIGDYIPVGNVKLSETGIHITSDDTKKTAFEWQIKRLIDSYQTTAFRSLEYMLIFLEKNIGTFDKWKKSDLYSSIVGLLINKATDFNKYVDIASSRRKYIELLPHIRHAEELFIIPAISQTYFDALIAEIKTANLSDDNKKILPPLQAALAAFAYANWLRNKNDKIGDFENIANKYLLKTIEYLNTNASSQKYKLYFESDVYTAPENYSGSFFDNKPDNSFFVT